MSVIGSNIIAGASGTVETGYQISRSLRFNSADSAALTRTLAASSRTTWTFSGWLKRAVTGADNFILSASGGTSNDLVLNFYINSSDKFVLDSYTNTYRVSTQVFRDVGAWYHLVVVWDTNNATAQNRARVWVNNTEITAWDTNATIASGQLGGINGAYAHGLGRREGINDKFFSGYMADVRFIDGQALTPSSFGETDSATGVWVPKAYTGTYGTNGFWLKFDDNSGTTSTTLGKDSSGNGNNWTPNNFSVTAGAGNDSLVDSPTNYGTDTGAGGEVRGNYCTLNPTATQGTVTLTNGNLEITNAANSLCNGTVMVTSGKWYWEVKLASGSDYFVGAQRVNLQNIPTNKFQVAGGAFYYSANGNKYMNGDGGSAYGASYTTNDVIGVALNLDANTLTFYKNNTSQGSISISAGDWVPCSVTGGTQCAYEYNFGQRPFAYTAPSGFKALCTQNLPTPAIGASSTTQANDYFNVVLYTGNGTSNATTQSITGVGFQPDLVWIKNRGAAAYHVLTDAVRGVNAILSSNDTLSEGSFDASWRSQYGQITAFGSDGFTVAAGSVAGSNFNYSANTYVGWAWNAGGSNATNTNGTITSTVRANTTAGFSIVTYTGNGTSGATVGHGLGVAPRMVITKKREAGGSDGWWATYHASLSANTNLMLNSTSAAAGTGTWTAGIVSAVSSSTFTLTSGGSGAFNVNDNTYDYVAYCFAEIAGFSKFGSYTGNGSADGVFVYLGFRPRFIMGRDATGVDNWWIYDSARNTYNVANSFLRPNLSDAEGSNSTDVIDFLSNGFKIRGASNFLNENGNTFIYAAFAEAPFNYARAR